MRRYDQATAGFAPAVMLVAAGAAINLPALVLGMLLAPLARWRRAEMFVVALLGLVVTAVLYSHITEEMEAALAGRATIGRVERQPGQLD